MLVRLGSGGAAEPGGRSGGAANAGRGGYKFEQIESDVFIAAGAEARTVESVQNGKVSKRDASRLRVWGSSRVGVVREGSVAAVV